MVESKNLLALNSRLDELQAALLREKLTRLDEWNARRKLIAHQYLTAFSDTGLVLPYVPEWADPVWHLFVIRSPQRDQLQAQLSTAGINTVIHYPVPPHRQAAYSELNYNQGTFPVSEKIHNEVLSLPMGPHLNKLQLATIIEELIAAAHV